MQERRSKGQRRWGLKIELPFIDRHGSTISTERRSVADRRHTNTSREKRHGCAECGATNWCIYQVTYHASITEDTED